MRSYNGARLIAACCFCLSYEFVVVFGASTGEKRDVVSSYNETANNRSDSAGYGDSSGLRQVPDDDLSSGLDGGTGLGNFSSVEMGPESQPSVSNRSRNDEDESGDNLTEDSGSFGDLNGGTIEGTGSGSNSTHDWESLSNSTKEKTKEEGSEGGLVSQDGVLDRSENSTVHGDDLGGNSTDDFDDFDNSNDDTIRETSSGSNSTQDSGSSASSANEKTKKEGSKSKNHEMNESEYNSTRIDKNKEPKSNSTGFRRPKNDKIHTGPTHTKPPTSSKETTSDSTLGNLLGGFLNREKKNPPSQKGPSSSGFETDDTSDWPNDQGSYQTGSKNSTQSASTDQNTSGVGNRGDGIIRGEKQNSSQSETVPLSSSNYTFGEKLPSSSNTTSPEPISTRFNVTSPDYIPISSNSTSPDSTNPSHQFNTTAPHEDSNSSSSIQKETSSTNVTNNSTQRPSVSTTPSPDLTSKYASAYWIPIFNFDNDFFFLTKKGYAKLVNFPPPVIYSFTPVPLPKSPSYSSSSSFKPTVGQPRHQDANFFGSFFDSNPANFADCYVDSNIGSLIPYSYFGSWVAVFDLESGWNLETYAGYVPLDLYGENAPLTYEFVPTMYDLSAAVTPTSTEEVVFTVPSNGFDEGLATWGEPLMVVED